MSPRVVNGIMSDDEKNENEIAKNEKRFHSVLKSLKETNGIRPGEFSVLLGQQGNGKSAFCKTIAMGCVAGGKNCYHLLSEESSSIYKSNIENAFKEASNGNPVDNFTSKLFFDSMLDWNDSELTIEFLFSHLETQIRELKIEMIIFDNFTTSFIGELNINIQGKAVRLFRKIAKEYDIAIVGVFHTAKGTDIYKKLVTGEDVRGNSTSTNGSSYVYILTTFFRSEFRPRVLLLIEKARYHSCANKTYWELVYNANLGLYTADKKIDHNSAQGIIDEATRKRK